MVARRVWSHAPQMPTSEPAPPPDALALPRSAAEALFAARTVLVFGEIDTALARSVTTQLLALAADGDAQVRIVVHSPGGHVEAGDTMHDAIRAITPDAEMVGTGWVASAGALVYAAAKKENRIALPNTRFLLHQPLGGTQGRASDVEIEAEQIVAMRARLNRIFAEATGQPYDRIVKDTERNFWMTAREACSYGLVGRIVEKLPPMGPVRPPRPASQVR